MMAVRVDMKLMIFLLLLRNDWTVRAVGEEILSSPQPKTSQTGLGQVIGSLHSRLRSVFRTPQQKKKKRRRNRLRKVDTLPRVLQERNDYSLESMRQMPKIYMTKLPERIEEKEPKIFFTKVIKVNESLVAVDKRREGSGVTDAEEAVIKSDMLYQDGVENVNDRIDDTQQVNQPGNNVKSYNGKKTMSYNSTMFPILEHVSSTAMIIGHKDNNNDNLDIMETVGIDIVKFGGADNIVPSTPTKDSFIKDGDWVLPMIILSSLTIVSILLCEVCIMVSVRRSVLGRARHLVLGQVLLLGLVCSAIMALLHTLRPSPALCRATQFCSGLAFSTIYSTLLVKMIALISVNSEIHLPATYQVLLLFFAVLIQLVIGSHQLLAGSDMSCPASFHQQLHSNIYNLVLLVMLTILSVKFRNIKPAYREAYYICGTVVLNLLIWSVWLIAGYLAHRESMAFCTSTMLLASTLATFTIMFLPRGRQLLSRGKEGVYSKDRPELYNRKISHQQKSLPNISLFSLNSGHAPVENIILKRHGASQGGAHGFLISKMFDRQRSNQIPISSSSEVDGDIYSLAEEISDGEVSNQTEPGIGATRDAMATQQSYDRFPFSSRPPQFSTNTRPDTRPAQLYRVYSQATKVSSKPSLSNPNVLFCTPHDMTRSIIY